MEQITEISIKEISLSGFRNQKEPVSFALGDVKLRHRAQRHRKDHPCARGSIRVLRRYIFRRAKGG